MINMVTSVDGATTVGGGSTGLNDDDDIALFNALRAAADVVLVGAETVRVEDYGPVRLDTDTRERRRAAGRRDEPRLAVVSRSLDLDPRSRLFSGPPPYVFTGENAPPQRRGALEEVAEVVSAGQVGADVTAVLARLHEDGHRVVLCEGGPDINGHLATAGVIDEVDLTVSPLLVGGFSKRAVDGPLLVEPARLRLDRVLTGDQMVFLRFRRG
jgi:riboflavin biosynthesis pyrimidine reductase